MFYEPINSLPQKCAACGFPDLGHLPQPYLLVESRTRSPNELAEAENGNFLIRDRIKRVLEIVAPGVCDYFATYSEKTRKLLPWLLAVPRHQVVTARVDPAIPRCQTCGEPRSSHPGSQWVESLLNDLRRPNGWNCELQYDLVRSATWASCETGWDKWIDRDLFISVRLLHLFKKIKAKGFYEATCLKTTSPDKSEIDWINSQLTQLKLAGVPLHPAGLLSDEDVKWMREFLKSHKSGIKYEWDLKSVERQLKVKLPKSYVDFIGIAGPFEFHNVDGQDGFCVCILPPNELEFDSSANLIEDEESRGVNALIFATAECGDFFCFDAKKGVKEYSVYQFKHEYNYYEPYAENFASCVKRFHSEH